MKRYLATILVSALTVPTVGCSVAEPSSAGEPEATDEYSVVVLGKADNYYSDVAAEFEVSGSVDVEFASPADADDPILRADAIGRRTTAVALYLTAYFTKKLDAFFTNTSYGGFSAMARNHTLAPGDIEEASANVLRVQFTIDVGGPKDLMEIVPRLEDAPLGQFQFDLVMPQGAEADPNSVPRGSIRNFDPEIHDGELEHIRCAMKPEKTPADAYPQTARMMDDGVFDITLFYGHDYNAERSDLSGSSDAFYELGDLGFSKPVEDFEELSHDSGPFVQTMQANGRDVRVEIRIFHSNMFIDDRKLGHDTALRELVARDVFFYNGHAGPYYGFYLSDDKPNDVAYSEFATLAMSEKQQIVVAQGCQTYSQYADVLYANPSKSEDNLDVITTVNFSYGIGVMGIVRNLLGDSDSLNPHRMVTFGSIIRDLNGEYWNDNKEVFYGVMGIDGNPQVHPYAALDKIGRACSRPRDCGDPDGNVCVVPLNASRKVCGAVALNGAACPGGSHLRPLAQGDTITAYACLP